jgi:dihydrofolate reductase
MRPLCSVFIAVSIDGFIARPDGSTDWLSIVEQPGEDHGYRAFHDSIDALVLGRKTYELALGFGEWPYAGKRCIVRTHAKLEPRHGEEFYSGEIDPLLNDLAAAGSKRVYVDGGAVIQQFLALGLVDDMTISVIPITLGEGIPLFGKSGPEGRWKLTASRAFDSGLVQTSYERVRRV